MLLVDTNVLVDVLQDDPQCAPRSIGQLHAQASVHQLTINPITNRSPERGPKEAVTHGWTAIRAIEAPCMA